MNATLWWSLGLAVAWIAMTGTFTTENVVLGFVLGVLVVSFTRFAGSKAVAVKFVQSVRFAGFYLWSLMLANLRVAFDVVTREHRMRAGVIAVPLDAQSDAEITLLAHLITLTPGSTTIDLSHDRKTLYVHVMYIENDDIERSVAEIKDGIERRILELTR
jgi:multicomponent Na+:H+ antiporter subunit E